MNKTELANRYNEIQNELGNIVKQRCALELKETELEDELGQIRVQFACDALGVSADEPFEVVDGTGKTVKLKIVSTWAHFGLGNSAPLSEHTGISCKVATVNKDGTLSGQHKYAYIYRRGDGPDNELSRRCSKYYSVK